MPQYVVACLHMAFVVNTRVSSILSFMPSSCLSFHVKTLTVALAPQSPGSQNFVFLVSLVFNFVFSCKNAYRWPGTAKPRIAEEPGVAETKGVGGRATSVVLAPCGSQLLMFQGPVVKHFCSCEHISRDIAPLAYMLHCTAMLTSHRVLPSLTQSFHANRSHSARSVVSMSRCAKLSS